MTNAAPSQPQSGASRWTRSRGARALLLGALAVAILVGAATIWYFFFRPAGPPAIGTQAPVIPPGAVATAPASTPSATPIATQEIP